MKRGVVFLLAIWLVHVAGERVVAAAWSNDASAGSLLASVPRQAILVFYCPSLERLAGAWELLAPVRHTKDFGLTLASEELKRVDKEFLGAWAERLGLTMDDLTRALPGEVMVGWLPRLSQRSAAFDADNWVLVARRSTDRDEALLGLWQRVTARAAKEGKIVRRPVGGIAVEEVLWEERGGAQLSPGHGSRKRSAFGEGSGRSESQTFSGIIQVEKRGMSLGTSEQYVFFAAARAEVLEPWIRAAVEGLGAAGSSDRLRSLVREGGASGEPVLAVKVTPSAWVAPVVSETERRLGGHPLNVLLSQLRSAEAVMTQRGDQLFLDVEATVLPTPGWVARLLATLGDGAGFSGGSDCSEEISLRANFPQLWKTLRTVLMEGWPAVGMALDLLLAPLGGERDEGIAQLATTLGSHAAMFVFRPTENDDPSRTWAFALEVNDPTRFAHFEPRLELLLGTFSHVPVHYTVTADGRLQLRSRAAATTAPATAPRLHLARWDSHFAIAGSPAALQRAVRAVSARPAESVDPAGPHPSLALLGESWQGKRPAMIVYHEVMPGAAGKLSFGGQTHRVVRTQHGTFELISPPAEGETTGTQKRGERPDPAAIKDKELVSPVAQLAAALVVESENSVRLRVGLRCLEGGGGETKRPRTFGRREAIMQE